MPRACRVGTPDPTIREQRTSIYGGMIDVTKTFLPLVKTAKGKSHPC